MPRWLCLAAATCAIVSSACAAPLLRERETASASMDAMQPSGKLTVGESLALLYGFHPTYDLQAVTKYNSSPSWLYSRDTWHDRQMPAFTRWYIDVRSTKLR